MHDVPRADRVSRREKREIARCPCTSQSLTHVLRAEPAADLVLTLESADALGP
jgi:hypothetical protein